MMSRGATAKMIDYDFTEMSENPFWWVLTENKIPTVGSSPVYWTIEEEDMMAMDIANNGRVRFFVVIGGMAIPIEPLISRDKKGMPTEWVMVSYRTHASPCKRDKSCEMPLCRFKHNGKPDNDMVRNAINEVERQDMDVLVKFYMNFTPTNIFFKQLIDWTSEMMEAFPIASEVVALGEKDEEDGRKPPKKVAKKAVKKAPVVAPRSAPAPPAPVVWSEVVVGESKVPEEADNIFVRMSKELTAKKHVEQKRVEELEKRMQETKVLLDAARKQEAETARKLRAFEDAQNIKEDVANPGYVKNVGELIEGLEHIVNDNPDNVVAETVGKMLEAFKKRNQEYK